MIWCFGQVNKKKLNILKRIIFLQNGQFFFLDISDISYYCETLTLMDLDILVSNQNTVLGWKTI